MVEMSSHVREGKGAAVATPAGVFAGCAEKDVALALEFGRGEPLGVQLDLAEGGGAADLVFGDEVDLAFALAVPPAAETGVAPGFGQLRGEIAFERETGEGAPVALYSVRKREVIANLLEWASGGEIPVRVADERNVEVIANASADGRSIVITVIVLRADVIDRLDLMFAGEWLDAAVEELDAGGIWRTFKTEMTDECRIRRFGGEFRPGISRIFRLRRE